MVALSTLTSGVHQERDTGLGSTHTAGMRGLWNYSAFLTCH